jgi:cell wall-associated NlpC family hydrolase
MIRKFILWMIFILIVSISSYSQTADTTLNKFIWHWVGKPYRLGGTTERGIDCSNFNRRLYNEVYEIKIPDVCYKQWRVTERVKRDSLRVGDLLFFSSKESPSGWHCGTYIGNNLFVHAANKAEGVKISTLDEPKYKRRYKGAGRKR